MPCSPAVCEIPSRRGLLPDEALRSLERTGVAFVFGFDAKPNVVALAEEVPASKWRRLRRPPRYEVETEPRRKRPPVKEELVKKKGRKNLVLKAEHIMEIAYRPGKCRRHCRMIVLKKEFDEKRGQKVLFERHRYIFYVTNDPDMAAEEVVRGIDVAADLILDEKTPQALRLELADELGNPDLPARARSVLRRVADTDPDPDVREEARKELR